MSEFDPLLMSTLDRLYPPATTPADWPDVLARAEQIRHLGEVAAQRTRPRRWLSRGGIGMCAAAVVVVLVASLAVTSPWQGGPSFIAKALAAIGDARYVIATVEPVVPSATDVNLATSREKPVRVAVTYSLDSKRIEYLSRTSFDGVAAGSETAGPDPALAAFATGYRAALAKGTARIVGQTTVQGRKARIIRFKVTAIYEDGNQIQFLGAQPTMWEDVAVDETTYKPLWFRQGGLTQGGAAANGFPSKVIAIKAVASRPRISAVPLYDGTITTLRRLAPPAAARALGRTALWGSARLAGLPLRSTLLQRVTTSVYPVVSPPIRTARGLRVTYQQGSQRIEINEAAVPLGGYGYASPTRTDDLGAIPPVGTIRISKFSGNFAAASTPFPSVSLSMRWTGQLRSNGLYLTIRATSRKLLLEAAHSLTPMD